MKASKLILSNGRVISEDSPVFIIAEIGQNHQGDINIAKTLIKKAKECGADCVKFQKSDLEEKFTKVALDAPYKSPHSWGETYREHKNHLEFKEEQFRELQKYATDNDVLFSASAMDIKSLKLLDSLNVPFIKIGSGDSTNILLLQEAAKTAKPLVISTGMCSMKDVEVIYRTISEHHNNFALLQCVSAYPTPPKDANIGIIPVYKSKFPVQIGYSGHEISFTITLGAVALGAKIVERHITLDKNMKGNDHSCSLDIREFKKMVKGIREMEAALGTEKSLLSSEEACWKKLGKSIIATHDINKGSMITVKDVSVKVCKPHGVPGNMLNHIVGKIALCDILADSPILLDCVVDQSNIN